MRRENTKSEFIKLGLTDFQKFLVIYFVNHNKLPFFSSGSDYRLSAIKIINRVLHNHKLMTDF